MGGKRDVLLFPLNVFNVENPTDNVGLQREKDLERACNWMFKNTREARRRRVLNLRWEDGAK